MVPFDWQAHDTYFVVAHFHYVVGGVPPFSDVGGALLLAPTLNRAHGGLQIVKYLPSG